MDIRTMTNFLKIAEYENITKAAEELHIAQPHLTRQIQTLEAELGVTLFVREKKRLHITEEGLFLKQQIQQILDLVDKTTSQVHEMHNGVTGILFIGAIETAGWLYLPKWISGFKQQYPNVRYDLWSGNSVDVTERLDHGLLDLGLVREPFDHSKYEGIHVSDDQWVALMSREHPLAKKDEDTISIQELKNQELLVPAQRVAEMNQWFETCGIQSNITCGFSPLMNGVIMAECGLGIAILPESCYKMSKYHQVAIRKINESRTSGVYLIWKKNSNKMGVAKRFLDYVKTKL